MRGTWDSALTDEEMEYFAMLVGPELSAEFGIPGKSDEHPDGLRRRHLVAGNGLRR